MMVLEGGAADGILEVGDKIREVDGMPLSGIRTVFRFDCR